MARIAKVAFPYAPGCVLGEPHPARQEFMRAYLNRWTTAMADPIIPMESREALAEPDPPRPERVILALDVAPRPNTPGDARVR
jgi:hypothetical protein